MPRPYDALKVCPTFGESQLCTAQIRIVVALTLCIFKTTFASYTNTRQQLSFVCILVSKYRLVLMKLT